MNHDQRHLIDSAISEASLLQSTAFRGVVGGIVGAKSLGVPEAQLDLPIPKKAGKVIAALVLSGDPEKILRASEILDTLHGLATIALKESLLGKPKLQFKSKKPPVPKK